MDVYFGEKLVQVIFLCWLP